MKRAARVTAMAILPVMASCSANHHSIYRNQPLDGSAPSVTLMDAKQRAILHSNAEGIQRFCSEPSPDVFAVIAQAFSASGSLSKSADPTSLQTALTAAFTTAEQGSTIPRTQTINMLRELMFRTCERYLSGAYSDLEMSIQAVRDQRLMISILAIEQLTGAVTPRPVVIGSGGTGSSGAGGDAIVRIDDAKKSKEAAAKTRDTAQATFDTVNEKDKKICDAIAETLKTGKPLTDDQTAKKDDCDKARSDLTLASQRATESNDYFMQLQRLASGTGGAVSTYLTSSAPGGIDRALSESVVGVAKTVEDIVFRSFNDDTEVMLFCLKALRETEPARGTETEPGEKSDKPAQTKKSTQKAVLTEKESGLRESCLSYLRERVDSEKHELMLAAEAAASASTARRIASDRFEAYWETLQKTVDTKDGKAKFIAQLKDRLPSTEADKANCFTAAKTKDAYRECFVMLPAPLQRKLSEVR